MVTSNCFERGALLFELSDMAAARAALSTAIFLSLVKLNVWMETFWTVLRIETCRERIFWIPES